VAAGPAREHVRALGQQGIGWRRAAELAGISKSTMRSLMFGASGRDASAQIRPETAAAVLAVPAASRNVAPGTPVDATGTRRRVEALVATGWSRAKLGERLGIEPTGMSELLRREQVTAGRARAVADLYDELWNRPPPEREWREKISAARSRNYAREHGWAPPAAWDDDLIDNPRTPPPAGWQRTSATPRGAELAEEAAELLRQDYTRELAAERLGVSRNTLDKAIERHQASGREHEAQRARFAAASATTGVVAERQAAEAQPIEMEAG
jgi:transcriptional regulator with XRE-family HTH domain